jgi:flagellar biosynthesis protein FliR
MFALFTRFGGRLAAFGAIAAGIVTWPLGRFVLAFEHPYTIALVVSLVLYVGLALAEPHLGKQPATPATPSPT